MKWILYAIANTIVMIICYITNPIVCLFSNEYGELPSIFRYWQTWDDTLNPRFFVLEKVPNVLKYDYDKHYKEYRSSTPELEKLQQDRCFVNIIDPNFTIKERIQRYICRVLWLTRNCGYGWAFYVFGKIVNRDNIVIDKNITDSEGRFLILYTDKSTGLLDKVWSFKCNQRIMKGVVWEIFLGWKIGIDYTTGNRNFMIANRLVIRFE